MARLGNVMIGFGFGWYFVAARIARRLLAEEKRNRAADLRYWISERDRWRDIAERAIERETRQHERPSKWSN